MVIVLLQKCKSPYIVEFFGASLEEGEWLIRLELMDGLSLDRYQQLPLDVLGPVSVSITNGLRYLWSLKIMHRGNRRLINAFTSLFRHKTKQLPREHKRRCQTIRLRSIEADGLLSSILTCRNKSISGTGKNSLREVQVLFLQTTPSV